jgi:PAS domain S-box-containing protein
MSASAADGLELLEGHSIQRQICEQLGMAVIAADRDMRISLWNAAAARLFGAAAEAVLGTSVLSIVPTDRRSFADEAIRRALQEREIVEFEFHHRDHQGKQRELAATLAPLISDAGETVGVSLCVRDITRRIELETELHEGRKMIALGDLAGRIAHHFNNIFGGVITSLDYARTNPDRAVTERVLDHVARALLRATTLVNGLLVFAEGGAEADDRSDLTELIFGLADDIEPAAHAQGIRLVLDVPKLPVTPVSRVPVLTILRNVVQNAVEAMPQGGTLRIDAAVHEERIEIRVCDTGSGLDEAARARVFEPFWTTKPAAAGGTPVKGLGLAIAYGLVQTLRGSVSVSSEPGEGTCFTISLPLRERTTERAGE